MTSIRRAAPCGLVLFLLFSLASRGQEERATTPSGVSVSTDITPRLIAAVDKGLAWLASRQSEWDGTFNEQMPSQIAVTSLSVLAFMANGSTESRGRYKEQVSKGVNYLLQWVNQEDAPADRMIKGYITHPEDPQSRMHGHGYATMTLALAYGMADDRPAGERAEFRRRLELAVRCIERSQDDSGGWGYLPVPESHEGSITVCQVWALRAAREAGIKVDTRVIAKAIRYLERSQDAETGGFCYSLTERKRLSYPLTAAALSTLFGLGEYHRRPMIEKGIRYLESQNEDNFEDRFHTRRMRWFLYGNFYAAQALWQAAGSEWAFGYWRKWWPRMRDELIRMQRPDGRWNHPGSGSTWGVASAYSTAMATLILQVPYEILPIYVR